MRQWFASADIMNRQLYILSMSLATLGFFMGSCTRAVRISPQDYAVALTDTSRVFQIRTKNGDEFVSRKATVQDTVLVVTSGREVQTDPWRQKRLASVPFHISMHTIEAVSQIDVDQDRTLVVVLFSVALVFGVAAVLALGGLYAGGS